MSLKAPTHKELKKFIVKYLKFVFVRQTKTSHAIYEGKNKGVLYSVTLDSNHDKFPPPIQKQNVSSMSKQMGYKNTKEFKIEFKKFLKKY